MTTVAKKTATKAAKVAILNLGLHAYVLPVENALVVLKLMKDAEMVHRDYSENRITYRRTGQEFELGVEAVVPSALV